MLWSPKLKLLGLAICWVIWAEHKNRIFFFFCYSNVYAIICKIDHLLIAWINATSNFIRHHFKQSLPTIKCSLVFVGARIPDPPSCQLHLERHMSPFWWRLLSLEFHRPSASSFQLLDVFLSSLCVVVGFNFFSVYVSCFTSGDPIVLFFFFFFFCYPSFFVFCFFF